MPCLNTCCCLRCVASVRCAAACEHLYCAHPALSLVVRPKATSLPNRRVQNPSLLNTKHKMSSVAQIGERRSYDSALCTVRYVGEVAGTTGSWLGVEWDDPSRGKHDGQHKGVRYFSCRHDPSNRIHQQHNFIATPHHLTSPMQADPSRRRPRHSCVPRARWTHPTASSLRCT